MKLTRILLILAALSLPVFGQTTTYTGTIRDLSNAVVTSGNVTFTLTPSIDTTISGISRFVPSTVTCGISGTGTVLALDLVNPCTVTQNTALTPTGTSYKVCIQPYFTSPGSCFIDFAVTSSKDITTVAPTPALSPSYNYVTSAALAAASVAHATTATNQSGGTVNATGVSTFVEPRVSGSPIAIDATAFGVKCDNVTNDATALQAAIDAGDVIARNRYSGSLQTPILRFPAGRCRIGSALTMKNVNLEGRGALNGTQLYWDGPAHGTLLSYDSTNASRRPHIRGISFNNGTNYPDTYIYFGTGITFDQQAPILEELWFNGSYSHALDISPASVGFPNAHFHRLRFDAISGCAIRTSVSSTYANNDSWSIDDFTVDSSSAPSGNVTPGVFCFDNEDSGGGAPYGAPGVISVTNGRIEGTTFNPAGSGIVRLNKGTATNGAVGGWAVNLKNLTTSSASPFTGLVYSEATVTTEMPTVRIENVMQGVSRKPVDIAAGNYNNYTAPSVNYVSEYQSDRSGANNYWAFKFLDQTVFDATTAGYKLRIRNDTQDRTQIFPGKIVFGPGGSTAPDTTLTRSSAGVFDINAVLGATTPAAAIVTTLVANTSIKAGASGTAIADTRELVQSVHDCGTTTTCANTANLSEKIVRGTVALSSGTPSTAVVTAMTAFGGSTAQFYSCWLTNETTAANGVKYARTSSSSITITGPNTVTDVISYLCIGH